MWEIGVFMRLQQNLVGFNYEDHSNGLMEEEVFTSEDRRILLDKIKTLKATISKLEHSADTDPLVPVKNRRAFIREIERAQTVASRYDIPSCVIFFDLNKFKEINDFYGHGIGDELLIKIGKGLKASVRDSDIVARLGGDEFGVILFKTDEQFAQTKAVILARQITKQRIVMPDGEISLTAAWGTSPCRPDNSVQQILDRADRAMYQNKHKNNPGNNPQSNQAQQVQAQPALAVPYIAPQAETQTGTQSVTQGSSQQAAPQTTSQFTQAWRAR